MLQPDNITSAELVSLVLRMEEATQKIAALATQTPSTLTFQTKIDGEVTKLREDVERLYGFIKGLEGSLNSHDVANPGILSRLQSIERSLEDIEKILRKCTDDSNALVQYTSKLHDFEKDCSKCREMVDGRFKGVDTLVGKVEALQKAFDNDKLLRDQANAIALEEAKERKEDKKNLKNTIIGQAIVIVIAVAGAILVMIRDNNDYVQQQKIIKQYQEQLSNQASQGKHTP